MAEGSPAGLSGSVFGRKRLHAMPLDLGFRSLVVVIRAVETHALRGPGRVDVGAQHIPALAQVQHAMMPLSRPTLGRDSHPLFLGHVTRSLSSPWTSQVARLQRNHKYALPLNSARVSSGPEGHVRRSRTWSQDRFRSRRGDPLGSFSFSAHLRIGYLSWGLRLRS